MSVMDEGVTKYRQDFSFIPSLPANEYRTVEEYRRMLHKIKLIGVYDNDLGFGNISQRKDYSRLQSTKSPQFIISGTQTGHLPILTGDNYTRVVDFNIDDFSVTAQGVVRASSETVTHGSIYEMNPNIKAIIHFHHNDIWKKMIEANYPGTGKWVIYGTYEMAVAVKECVADNSQGIFVMRGHEDGGVAFGPSLNAAMNIVANTYKAFIDAKFTL
jgi:ribulose-5-phosphate 4-epimerase/fuculose-1-phosphate aldolase